MTPYERKRRGHGQARAPGNTGGAGVRQCLAVSFDVATIIIASAIALAIWQWLTSS